MKYPQCQFENSADTRFCGNCGTQIRPVEDISASQTKTAQTPVKEIDRGTVLSSRYEIIELLGMKDEAIQNIELAIAQGLRETKTYPYHYRYLVNNPFYDSLRDDPRFQRIVKKQEEWYKENLRKFGDI